MKYYSSTITLVYGMIQYGVENILPESVTTLNKPRKYSLHPSVPISQVLSMKM